MELEEEMELVSLLRETAHGPGWKIGVAVALRGCGWTQEEIARELTVGQSTVQRWLARVRVAVDREGAERFLEAALVAYRAWTGRGRE